MTTLPLPRDMFIGGPADAFAGRGRRMSRPAVVVSILAHLAVLYGASQMYEAGPAPIETAFEWVTMVDPPREPAVQPLPEVVESPAPVVAPAPPPRSTGPRAVSPPIVEPPQPVVPAEVLPVPPVGPSRLDLDVARRTAAAEVVQQHARDGSIRAPSVDDGPPREAPRAPGPKKPSIFDPQRHSGGSFLSPSRAHTVFGQRLSFWCNKVSGGGFGFFGIPVCASGTIEPPSGILTESIPEYMKLKPECEETQPLAATLGESAPSTMKCRLVPKDPNE
ncbi:MAG: hypothetical protein ABI640_11680 [Gammaproteobacteria bacterium]